MAWGSHLSHACKLMPKNPVTHLIINGAECEPYITADYRLMLEKPQEIIEGILLLKKALKANKAHIGIEDNKPQAIETMTALCQDKGINVVSLKTKYPQGGEKQLIYAITKKWCPRAVCPPMWAVWSAMWPPLSRYTRR